MNVDRKELLQQLESVTPGLSTRDIVEQSSCFVFLKGRVVTFNDEIACSTKCCLKIEGAVQATPLLGVLRKAPEETLAVLVEDKRLILNGKRRRGRIHMDDTISLPFKSVGEPKYWTTLPADFLEAVNLVHRCAGKNEQKLEVYVHIARDRVEAIGAYQVGHFRTKIDLKQELLIHKNSIRHIVPLGMTEMALTESWVHFQNSSGLMLSCRRWDIEEEFPRTDDAVGLKGAKVTLPKGLEGATERAAIFAMENPEHDDIQITLKSGRVIVEGTGPTGDWREVKSVGYHGADIIFMISSKLLMDLCRKHNEAVLTPDALKVTSGKFTFVTGLGIDDGKEQSDGENEGSDPETSKETGE